MLYNIIERQKVLTISSHILEISLITIYLTNFSHHENEQIQKLIYNIFLMITTKTPNYKGICAEQKFIKSLAKAK